MTKIKLYDQLILILCIFFVFISLEGCSDEGCPRVEGCTPVTHGQTHCSDEFNIVTQESCEESIKGSNCASGRFEPGHTDACPNSTIPGECHFRCCQSCGDGFFGLNNSEKEPALKILGFDEGCTYIAKGSKFTKSFETCENESDFRVCNSFDFFQVEEDKNLNECLLYDCHDCVFE